MSWSHQGVYPMAVTTPITWQMRSRHFLVNCIAFSLCYPLANLLALNSHITRHIAFPFEKNLPFIPWMIIPYLSSGIFFAVSFIWVRTADDLRVLSQRLLLATVSATLIFALYPLQFSMARPTISNPLFAALFEFLCTVDRPYNQLPSLHVAFCFIFWRSLQTSWITPLIRIVLTIWLILVAVATVFTYQHHVIDVVTGLLLGVIVSLLIRHGKTQVSVAFYYLIAAGIVLLTGVLALHSLLALYLAVSLLLISRAYARMDHRFLHKQKGHYPLWIWLLYAPYLLGYRLTWYGVRWRERHRAPFFEISPRLWVGRRLSPTEASALPPQSVIIDLANELSEVPCLRTPDYHYFPMLDLRSPDATSINQIVELLIQEIRKGRTVYLHCAMGYSRSIVIAKHYMEKIAK